MDARSRASRSRADVERADVELADVERAAGSRSASSAAEDVEQLALLDVEPSIADQVGAHRCAPRSRPPSQQARRGGAWSWSAPRPPWPRPAGPPRRPSSSAVTRDAVAEARAAVQALMAAEAERERRDEDERREQLNRWYEQDRAAEQERGLDDGWDDGPSIDY